jgi:hypothetical protein
VWKKSTEPSKKPEISKQQTTAGFLLDYSLTLKTEAINSSETQVDFYETARHYNPEKN